MGQEFMRQESFTSSARIVCWRSRFIACTDGSVSVTSRGGASLSSKVRLQSMKTV